jgi:hypothetical protein
MQEQSNDYCDECAWPQECAARNGCQRTPDESNTEPLPHDTDPHPLEVASLAASVFLLMAVNWEKALTMGLDLLQGGALLFLAVILSAGAATWLVRCLRGVQ